MHPSPERLPHRPFPKIPRTLADTPGAGSLWVATEKIHGAQLTVACDGGLVRVGKRKAWLADDEVFFGWQLLRSSIAHGAQAIHRELGSDSPVYLYGELFGGRYPHPEVAAVPAMQPVQTGIWYGPSLYYAVFDILVFRAGHLWLIAHTTVEDLCARAGLMSVPRLGRGNRNTLSRLPVRYPTTVPSLLGLPAIADNVAEGFVLKPDVDMPAAKRPVVKHKIPEFDEAKFDESMAFDGGMHLSVAELVCWAQQMINPVRIQSAQSKVGLQPAAVIEEVVLDVWIDLEAMFSRRMAGLGEVDEEDLRTALFELARRVHGTITPSA